MAPAKQEKAHEILLKWLINKNLPFFVIDDTFFRLFVENLSATYNPPSADMISNRILTASFAKHLEAKLKKHAKIRDLTICLDGWTDGFGYFIYGFMALWQEIEHVLEINDLSAQRHNADFRKQELVEVLKLNGINTSSVIACVTDNPSVMVKMRNDLKVSQVFIVLHSVFTKQNLIRTQTKLCDFRPIFRTSSQSDAACMRSTF